MRLNLRPSLPPSPISRRRGVCPPSRPPARAARRPARVRRSSISRAWSSAPGWTSPVYGEEPGQGRPCRRQRCCASSTACIAYHATRALRAHRAQQPRSRAAGPHRVRRTAAMLRDAQAIAATGDHLFRPCARRPGRAVGLPHRHLRESRAPDPDRLQALRRRRPRWPTSSSRATGSRAATGGAARPRRATPRAPLDRAAAMLRGGGHRQRRSSTSAATSWRSAPGRPALADRHPASARARPLATLLYDGGRSAPRATTSASELDGERYARLLDPRTGQPRTVTEVAHRARHPARQCRHRCRMRRAKLAYLAGRLAQNRSAVSASNMHCACPGRPRRGHPRVALCARSSVAGGGDGRRLRSQGGGRTLWTLTPQTVWLAISAVVIVGVIATFFVGRSSAGTKGRIDGSETSWRARARRPSATRKEVDAPSTRPRPCSCRWPRLLQGALRASVRGLRQALRRLGARAASRSASMRCCPPRGRLPASGRRSARGGEQRGWASADAMEPLGLSADGLVAEARAGQRGGWRLRWP